jgi:hypothetical protein
MGQKSRPAKGIQSKAPTLEPSKSRLVTAKTRKGRRVLEKRAPQLVSEDFLVGSCRGGLSPQNIVHSQDTACRTGAQSRKEQAAPQRGTAGLSCVPRVWNGSLTRSLHAAGGRCKTVTCVVRKQSQPSAEGPAL